MKKIISLVFVLAMIIFQSLSSMAQAEIDSEDPCAMEQVVLDGCQKNQQTNTATGTTTDLEKPCQIETGVLAKCKERNQQTASTVVDIPQPTPEPAPAPAPEQTPQPAPQI